MIRVYNTNSISNFIVNSASAQYRVGNKQEPAGQRALKRGLGP